MLFLLVLCFSYSLCVHSVPFNSTWQITSDDLSLTLPLVSSGTYNFVVSWGDGSDDPITSYNQAQVTHTYINSGIYEVLITGQLTGFSFETYNSSAVKLLEISQWGSTFALLDGGYYFYECANFQLTATDFPILDEVTVFTGAFEGCSQFNGKTSKYINVSWPHHHTAYLT